MKAFLSDIADTVCQLWAGKIYLLLFLGAFFGFLYLTFPIDKIRPIVEKQLEAPLSSIFHEPVRVELSGFDTYRLTGVQADTAKILFPEKGNQPPLLIHRLRLQLNPFEVLLMRVGLWLKFEALNGKISGYASSNFKRTAFSSEIDIQKFDIEPAAALFEARLFGAKIAGQLSGKMNATIDLKKPKASVASVYLTIENPTVKACRVVVFDVPEIASRILTLDVSLKNGILTFRKANLDGDMIRADLTGEAKLQDKIVESTYDIKMNVFFSDILKSKMPAVQMATMGRTPDTNGNYTYAFKGQLNRLPIGIF